MNRRSFFGFCAGLPLSALPKSKWMPEEPLPRSISRVTLFHGCDGVLMYDYSKNTWVRLYQGGGKWFDARG